MSIDRSLKSASSLVRHRNVLTRAERLEILKEEEKWSDDKGVFGLPKVAHRKLELGKAAKEDAPAEGEAAAAGAAGAAPAAKGAAPAAKGAAPAAAAGKAAAPAAGAKAAAPAAKKK